MSASPYVSASTHTAVHSRYPLTSSYVALWYADAPPSRCNSHFPPPAPAADPASPENTDPGAAEAAAVPSTSFTKRPHGHCPHAPCVAASRGQRIVHYYPSPPTWCASFPDATSRSC